MVLIGSNTFGQAPLDVNGYSQNFDGISGITMPVGFIIQNKTGLGTSVDASISSLNSGSTGQSYKFQSGPTGSDYAIGFLGSSSFPTSTSIPLTISLTLVNNTSQTVSQLSLSFNYEKYRSGKRSWNWKVSGSSGTVPSTMNYTYPADADNTVSSFPPGQVAENGTITGLNIPAGGIYTITWTLAGDGGISNGQALGIDDINIIPTLIGSPTPLFAPPVSSTQTDRLVLSWTAPSGYNTGTNSMMAFIKQGSPITIGTPTNSVGSYTASSDLINPGTSYQNDAAAKCIYNGDGVNGANNGLTITGLAANATYYILLFNVVDATSAYSTGMIANATTLKIEPTNQPTNISISTGPSGQTSATLNWTDATGSQLPDKYLVIASTGSVAAPTDVIPQPDNSSTILNISQGVQAATFINLAPGTYNFSIYPYTNTGNNVNYKTDGTILTSNITTGEAILTNTGYSQNFDLMNGQQLPDGFITQNKASSAGLVDAVQSNSFNVSSTGQSYKFVNGSDYGIGFLGTSSFPTSVTLPLTVSLTLVNNTGQTVNELSLSLNYEKYRSGTRPWNWTIAVPSGTISSSLNKSYNLDADNATNYSPPLQEARNGTITGLNIPIGGTYKITWTLAGTGGSTDGQALGIDDIIISPNMAPPVISTTQPVCPITTGTITITSPAGTGLTYSIDGVTYQSSNIFNNVIAGTYNVTVKNSIGNVSPVTSTTINAVSIPSIVLGTISPICQYYATSFTIPYSSNSGADQYSISGTGITSVTNGSLSGGAPILVHFSSNPLTAGDMPFQLTVRNSSTGCISNQINGVVTVSPFPTLSSISQQGSACVGSGATINLNGLIPNSTFSIGYDINGGLLSTVLVTSDNTGFAKFTTQPLTLSNNGGYLVILNLISSIGCSQSTSEGVQLSVYQMPTSTISLASPICIGQGAIINLSNLQSGTHYSIRYQIDGIEQPAIADIVANSSNSGSFTTSNLTSANNGSSLNIIAITTLDGCVEPASGNLILTVTDVWLGTNTDWNDAANWCNGVPTQTTNVLIPGGLTNYPNLNTGTGLVDGILIQGNGNVIVSSGAILKIYGAINITDQGILRAIGTNSKIEKTH